MNKTGIFKYLDFIALFSMVFQTFLPLVYAVPPNNVYAQQDTHQVEESADTKEDSFDVVKVEVKEDSNSKEESTEPKEDSNEGSKDKPKEEQDAESATEQKDSSDTESQDESKEQPNEQPKERSKDDAEVKEETNDQSENEKQGSDQSNDSDQPKEDQAENDEIRQDQDDNTDSDQPKENNETEKQDVTNVEDNLPKDTEKTVGTEESKDAESTETTEKTGNTDNTKDQKSVVAESSATDNNKENQNRDTENNTDKNNNENTTDKNNTDKTEITYGKWQKLDDNKYRIYVKEGEEYKFDFEEAEDDKFPTIKFTKIDTDKNAEDTRYIDVEVIELTDEQKEALGSLTDKAYDITSPMENETFEYALTFPVDDEVSGDDVTIGYVEDKDDLEDVNKLKNDDVVKDVTDDSDVDVDVDTDENTVKATNVDHFTVWFPWPMYIYKITKVKVDNGNTTTVNSGETVGVKVKARLRRFSWRSTAYKIGDGDWQCHINDQAHVAYARVKVFTETFDITAPTDAGTYDLTVKISPNRECDCGDNLNNGGSGCNVSRPNNGICRRTQCRNPRLGTCKYCSEAYVKKEAITVEETLHEINGQKLAYRIGGTIEGWPINLCKFVDDDITKDCKDYESTTTSSDGSYSFDELPNGVYRVAEDTDHEASDYTPMGATSYIVYLTNDGEYYYPEGNLVTNGGFESPIVTSNWQLFPNGYDELGWEVLWFGGSSEYNGETRPDTALLELQRSVNGWVAKEGKQYAELDTDWGYASGEPANVKIYQVLTSLCSNTESNGMQYELSYDWSPRPGIEDNQIKVTLTGDNLSDDYEEEHSASGVGLSQPQWHHETFTFNVVPTGEPKFASLQFTEIGTPDSFGMFVDNVTVKSVSDKEMCELGNINFYNRENTENEVSPVLMAPIQTGYNEDNGDGDDGSVPHYPDANEIACMGGSTNINHISVHWRMSDDTDYDNLKYLRQFTTPSNSSWQGHEVYTNEYTNFRTFGGNPGTPGVYQSRVMAWVDDDDDDVVDTDELQSDWSNICEVEYLGPACVEGDSAWANEVISSNQGTTKAGNTISSDRSNPDSVLGENDGIFFSIGVNGDIEVELEHPITDISGISGDDLVLYETTYGRSTYPEEKAKVYVKQVDAQPWVYIGEVTNTSEEATIDFGHVGFTWVQYIKVVDSTDYSLHQSTADGFDLDAVKGISQTCENDLQPEEPQLCGNGIVDEDEECDGEAGVEDGYFCTSTCQLVPIYEFGGNQCPTNTKQILTDTLTLDGHQGNVATYEFAQNQTYVLEANGDYGFGSNGERRADAAYAYSNTSDNSNFGTYGVNRGVTSVIGNLGNGYGIIDWGDYNSSHTYSGTLNFPVNTNVEFVISDWYDDWYESNCSNQSCLSDNEGTIDLNVYKCVEEIQPSKPVCDENQMFVKINTDYEGDVWYGNKLAPKNEWFVLEPGATTSDQTEGAVLTYDDGDLTISLLKKDDNSYQAFAGTIEFYKGEVTALTEGIGFDKLENESNCGSGCHLDVFKLADENLPTSVVFDFAITTANDKGTISLRHLGCSALESCAEDFSVNNSGAISTIDLSTGTETLIDTLMFGSSAAASEPTTGNVYYIERWSSNNNGNKRLAYYDINSRTNVLVGNTGIKKVIDKLAFDQNGKLYAMSSDSFLYTINTSTAVATELGKVDAITRSGGDLTFDDHGDLYAHVKGGKLYKINIATLEATEVRDTDIQSTGMVYKDNGKFYATDNAERLFSFDFASSVNQIADSTRSINDLASCPVKVKTSTVTVCKEDTKGRRLSGWNVSLLGEDMNDIKVPVQGGDPVYSEELAPGSYVLVASGYYYYRGNSGLKSDANFSERLASDGYTGPYFPKINVNDFNPPHTGWLGIMINNTPTNWSDYPASDYKYYLGQQLNDYEKLNFRILDNVYGDNRNDNNNSLDVSIYKG